MTYICKAGKLSTSPNVINVSMKSTSTADEVLRTNTSTTEDDDNQEDRKKDASVFKRVNPLVQYFCIFCCTKNRSYTYNDIYKHHQESHSSFDFASSPHFVIPGKPTSTPDDDDGDDVEGVEGDDDMVQAEQNSTGKFNLISPLVYYFAKYHMFFSQFFFVI